MNIFLYCLFCFVMYGAFYITFEVIWDAINKKKPELKGQSSVWLFLIGGLSGLSLSVVLLFIPSSFIWSVLSLPMFIVGGGIFLTLVEFLSGLLFNKLLKFDLWDYSKDKFNFLGIIELFHSLGWLGIFFVIWIISQIMKYYFIK